MSMWIGLLGPLDIRHNCDGLWIRPKIPKKAAALLAFLAVRKARVARSAIADLLWPYQGPDQGRHSLRNCMLELRRVVGREMVCGDFECCWVNDDVTTDLDQLRACGCGEEMQAAVLYRGPLLSGIDIASDPWHEWLTYERDLAQAKAIEILSRGAERALAERRPEDAVSLGRKAVAIDPVYEPAHRQVMSGHHACGRPGEAARQYQRCAEVLRRELDVAPGPETVALMLTLRRSAPEVPETIEETPMETVDNEGTEYQRGYESGFKAGKLRGYEIAINHLTKQRDAAVARRGAERGQRNVVDTTTRVAA